MAAWSKSDPRPKPGLLPALTFIGGGPASRCYSGGLGNGPMLKDPGLAARKPNFASITGIFISARLLNLLTLFNSFAFLAPCFSENLLRDEKILKESRQKTT